MKIIREAVAGTLESSDAMVRIAPLDTNQIDLQVNSSVAKQFGEMIKQTVLDTLASLDVTSAQVIIDDKGALDCILKARIQAAVMRASDNVSDLPWSKF